MTTQGDPFEPARQAAAPDGLSRCPRCGDTPGVPQRRIPCVGAVIHDAEGKLLLIRRGHPPGEGLWSLPGGRVEPGETDHAAVIREISEETGLRIVPGALLGSVERPGPDGSVFDIRDYEATVTGGDLVPGDDASDARWVGPEGLRSLSVTPGLADALAAWNVLPGQRRGRRAGTGAGGGPDADRGAATATGTGAGGNG
ncbi:MAG: NUDIX hydrolase [Micromonosporaceae bacterium]